MATFFPPGYIACPNPSIGVPGILWFNPMIGSVSDILSIVAIPGSNPPILAVQLKSKYVLCDGASGVGDAGQTIYPDPAWSVSRIVFISESGRMQFWDDNSSFLPVGAPAQVITYTPNGSPKWTAKKVQ